ncbi:protein kintoun [Brienomyrus brachyistius]|uniref:protein kintoun n=1 Tax=Brienomyrus brachyistius TaxID=42636 RepID=UPI0020B1F30F|nr:protein kintoun [Brienomyrus brachyistius]
MDTNSKLEDLNLTPEEIDRFSNAFKDENFRELLKEYAEEISDPENKKRYEEEITQMEKERGMDIKFVHPNPGRVLKTSLDGKQKCFINVCSNELIAKPECKVGIGADGGVGQHWSLPYSVTPGRPNMDNKGNKYMIYDVVFHPDTLYIAGKNTRFMKLVDSTAIQGVQNQFNVKLDETNVKVLKMKYKGVPNPSVIRKPIPGQPAKQTDPDDPLRFPYPYDWTQGETQKPTKPTKPAIDPDLPKKPTIPRHTVKYRSYIDLQDYRCSRDSAPGPRPREMLIIIDLPLLKSAGDADLTVTERRLLLESRQPAYRLELPLSYPVDENKGEAKFNKLKGQLTVTLPVLQLKIPLMNVTDLSIQPVSGEESQITGSVDGNNESARYEHVGGGHALTKEPNEHDRGPLKDAVTLPSPFENTELLNPCKKRVSSHEPRESLEKTTDDEGVTMEQCLTSSSSSASGHQTQTPLFTEEVSQGAEEEDDEFADCQDSSGKGTDADPHGPLYQDNFVQVESLSFRTEMEGKMFLPIQSNEPVLAEDSRLTSTDGRGIQETPSPGEEVSLGNPSQPLPGSEQDTAICDTSALIDEGKDGEANFQLSIDGGEVEKEQEWVEDDLPTRQGHQSSDDEPPSVILREIDPGDGRVEVITDHTTSAAFRLQNTLLYELD